MTARCKRIQHVTGHDIAPCRARPNAPARGRAQKRTETCPPPTPIFPDFHYLCTRHVTTHHLRFRRDARGYPGQYRHDHAGYGTGAGVSRGGGGGDRENDRPAAGGRVRTTLSRADTGRDGHRGRHIPRDLRAEPEETGSRTVPAREGNPRRPEGEGVHHDGGLFPALDLPERIPEGHGHRRIHLLRPRGR